MSKRLTGVIKSFDNERKFGFIESKDRQNDFFHISDFKSSNNINVGDNVEFEIGINDRNGRECAKNILLISIGGSAATIEKKKEISPNNSYNKSSSGGDNLEGFIAPIETIEKINNAANFKFDNLNLLLNKFAYFKEDKFHFYKKEDHKKNEKGYDFKSKFNKSECTALIPGVISEQEKFVNSLFDKNDIIKKDYSPDWKLAIGVGAASVYETSICLHEIYGFPYIPAQSIKGVLRNFIMSEVYSDLIDSKGIDNKHDRVEEEAFKDMLFCYIFGSPKKSALGEHKGFINFFDAFPCGDFSVTPDIMNPHYPDYYSDKKNEKPPSDDQNPIPIFFLTVSNTKFRIIAGVNDNKFKSLFEKDEIKNTKLYKATAEKIKSAEKTVTPIEFLDFWLSLMAQEKGIGAKTSVGYGSGQMSKAVIN